MRDPTGPACVAAQWQLSPALLKAYTPSTPQYTMHPYVGVFFHHTLSGFCFQICAHSLFKATLAPNLPFLSSSYSFPRGISLLFYSSSSFFFLPPYTWAGHGTHWRQRNVNITSSLIFPDTAIFQLGRKARKSPGGVGILPDIALRIFIQKHSSINTRYELLLMMPVFQALHRSWLNTSKHKPTRTTEISCSEHAILIMLLVLKSKFTSNKHFRRKSYIEEHLFVTDKTRNEITIPQNSISNSCINPKKLT